MYAALLVLPLTFIRWLTGYINVVLKPWQWNPLLVYWIAVFQILESRGFEVKLVNAQQVKTVPGRKVCRGKLPPASFT
jgi:hypothetical protein